MNKFTFFYILLSACLVICCGEAPEVITENEKYETSDDSLYVQCAELKGLGNLHIDKTVFKHLLKDKSITTYKECIKSDFSGGFWGVRYNYDLSRHLESNKNIKQVQVGSYAFPYTIGELEFDEMELAFLNDTLVAISIGGDYYKIEDALVKKYGVGKGHFEFYCKSKGQNGDKNFYIEKRVHRQRVWENESVKFERKYDWDSKVKNNEHVYSIEGDDYCLITSKKNYNRFLQILEDSKKEYKNIKDNAKQQAYDML